MRRSRLPQQLLSALTVFSLVFSPVSPLVTPPLAHAATTDPSSRIVLANGNAVDTLNTFRTTVRAGDVPALKRIQQTGATLLIIQGFHIGRIDLAGLEFAHAWQQARELTPSSYPLILTLLVSEQQLQALARLQFKPRASDSLGSLVKTNGFGVAAAGGTLSLAMVAAGISDDSDGDGLTNTEEGWWCTDPNNQNSDGDAQNYTDGQEVNALLDQTLPRSVRWGYGPPFGPPAA